MSASPAYFDNVASSFYYSMYGCRNGGFQPKVNINYLAHFIDLWRRLFPCFGLSLRTRSFIIYNRGSTTTRSSCWVKATFTNFLPYEIRILVAFRPLVYRHLKNVKMRALQNYINTIKVAFTHHEERVVVDPRVYSASTRRYHCLNYISVVITSLIMSPARRCFDTKRTENLSQ